MYHEVPEECDGNSIDTLGSKSLPGDLELVPYLLYDSFSDMDVHMGYLVSWVIITNILLLCYYSHV